MQRLEFAVEYSYDRESGVFVATLPELGYVSSFGKTFAEAERNVTEAALAYLEALLEGGLPLPQSQPASGTVLVVDLAARLRACTPSSPERPCANSNVRTSPNTINGVAILSSSIRTVAW